MDRGIPLFKVRGIQIRMHYTFPVILIFAAIQFAQLGRMPEKPIQELVISIAGPLVNFVLAALLAVFGFAYGLDLGLQFVFRIPTGITIGAVFSYIFAANLFLGLFNLLPAFPMDGGRILRALLAMRMKYTRATRLACTSCAWRAAHEGSVPHPSGTPARG